ncbi:MAG: hypothetical protein JW818_13290 [Pirellulales bacterium]|nr:hypothetical protein [Pirellulales bacterium]
MRTGSTRGRVGRWAVWLTVGLICFGGAVSADRPAQEGARAVGLDETQLAPFVHGRPWSQEEQAALPKVFFRLDRAPLGRIEQATRPLPDWDTLLAQPASFRGRFFRLRGNIESVAPVRLPGNLGQSFDQEQYYRVVLQPDEKDPKRQAVIFALDVPKAWQSGGTIHQPGGAEGLFLKLDDSHQPVFAARRIAWRPDTLLGRLGMDVGLLDDLVDKQNLSPDERECFYQMLAAVGRAAPGELTEAARAHRADETSDSVVPLFNEPASQRGKLVLISGTARRVLRVLVDEPDIVERFGIDHYYELHVFTDDSQDNPVIFCVRELPEGMPTGDEPGFGETVEVAGFFLKSWAFRSEFGQTQPKRPRQLAPLLVGRQPAWRPHSESADPLGPVTIGLAVLALAVVLVVLWRFQRSDENFGHWRRHRSDASAEPVDSFDPDAIDSHR